MAFQTTLIIGLGGIGSRIVEEIYRKFDSTNPSANDRRNVAFLCLDTDEADIAKRRKVMPASSVIKTSSDLSDTVGGYISRIQDSTTVLDWFDTRSKQILTMPLNEGAAQVRMASRLAAMSAIEEGKFKAIDNSIAKLLESDPERHKGNNIKVHIISSLAGGTGAGSFLQVAYYVKDAMRSRGNMAPKISGYFVLADVLCDEINSGFSAAQRENVRSNTYACVKELVSFSNYSPNDYYKPIIFEYRMGQRDKTLPDNPPYDMCFMIDFTGANGGNLSLKERYEEQTVMFVYTNAFDPIGDQFRSMAINDVRQKIEQEGANRFASFGVSKLVYPVDDLMAYFARQRVYENLSGTWQRIDNEYYEMLAKYKKDRSEGLPAVQPNRGKHFRDTVSTLAGGDGRERAEFRQILEETKKEVATEGKPFMAPKSFVYLESVERKIVDDVAKDRELSDLYSECIASNPTFTSKDDPSNDNDFVDQREEALATYQTRVNSYIDNIKTGKVRECLVRDHDEENYVSRNHPDYHLNSYILEKENEMHPIAVRYLLYDIQEQLQVRLKEKEAEVGKLTKAIQQDYPSLFDNKETEEIEDASEYLSGAKDRHSGGRKLINLISFQNPYKEAKELYVKKSKQQADNIRRYLTEKLLAETYKGLLNQINLLVEESEEFFKSIPAIIASLKEEIQVLLKKHDFSNDPAVSFVLASEEIKKDIYDYVISLNDVAFFPAPMSASLYRSLFHNMVEKLDASGFKTSRKQTERERQQAALDANRKIFEECISYQEKLIRENNPEYSGKNVLSALDEEAKRECNNDPAKAHEYMLHRFNAFRDRAEIWGPSNLDTSVRYINAWGLHPNCLLDLPEKNIDEIFGATNVGTNETTAATRIVSEQFSPYEILRVNAVTLLTVEQNFKKFIFKPKTELGYEETGSYYQAYADVIKKMGVRDSRTYSPHLDKHWHLPAYMPNIGETNFDVVRKIFKALYSGLLFGNFFSVLQGGEYYWKFKGLESLSFIKDTDGEMIKLGGSQQFAIDNLFKGLASNPEIVEAVLNNAEKCWEKAKEDWIQKDVDPENELAKMKASKAVRMIDEFRFALTKQNSESKNWFTLLDSKPGNTLYHSLEMQSGRLKNEFYDEVIMHMIDIFGESVNTKSVCEYIFKRAGSPFCEEAQVRVDSFESRKMFQPNE